jgi:hypothetical protein
MFKYGTFQKQQQKDIKEKLKPVSGIIYQQHKS